MAGGTAPFAGRLNTVGGMFDIELSSGAGAGAAGAGAGAAGLCAGACARWRMYVRVCAWPCAYGRTGGPSQPVSSRQATCRRRWPRGWSSRILTRSSPRSRWVGFGSGLPFLGCVLLCVHGERRLMIDVEVIAETADRHGNRCQLRALHLLLPGQEEEDERRRREWRQCRQQGCRKETDKEGKVIHGVRPLLNSTHELCVTESTMTMRAMRRCSARFGLPSVFRVFFLRRGCVTLPTRVPGT